MFEVLVFVYQNYWRIDACPEPEQLRRKLSAQGFDAQKVHEALLWLEGLKFAARTLREGDLGTVPSQESVRAVATSAWLPQSAGAMRVYSPIEQQHLGREGLGFINFLETMNLLPASLRELVVDRALAAPGAPLSVEELKIILLMGYWSTGIEPDVLVLDELCDDTPGRVAH